MLRIDPFLPAAEPCGPAPVVKLFKDVFHTVPRLDSGFSNEGARKSEVESSKFANCIPNKKCKLQIS
jgi:hypothetical protein